MKECPLDAELLEWLVNDQGSNEIAPVAGHIGSCSNCQSRLDSLSDDTELSDWRHNGVVPATMVGEVEEIIQWAKQLSDENHNIDNVPPIPTDLPESIGPYGVDSMLGHGGMGIVYKAFDERLNRNVAIKVLHRHRVTESGCRRFEREAQAMAKVVHDNIVTIYDVESPGTLAPYFCMELVQGGSLREFMNGDDSPDIQCAADLIRQAALGLQAAHDAGVVHRDIKPSNILIEETTKRPKLSDFGLARLEEDRSQLTVQGQFMGTPNYMSPEQIESPDAVDPRSDVYGLGVTLYECLTGVVPFRGVPEVVIQHIVRRDPVYPRTINDQIPRDLETICLKAMARDPERRYQTAADLSHDLQSWLEGKPILARPVGNGERLWRWCRRNRAVASLLASTFLLVTTVAIVSTTAALMIASAVESERQAREETVVEKLNSLIQAEPQAIRSSIASVTPYREQVEDRLREVSQNAGRNWNERANAMCGLAEFGELDAALFLESLAHVQRNPSRCQSYVDALKHCPECIDQLAQAATDVDPDTHLQLASVLYHAGAAMTLDTMVANSQPPEFQSLFVLRYKDWHGDLQFVLDRFPSDAANTQMTLALACGNIDNRALSTELSSSFIELFQDQARVATDPGVRGAAEWVLRNWGQQILRIDSVDHGEPRWITTSGGLLMVRIDPGEFLMGGLPQEEAREPSSVKVSDSYWIADREVTVALFRRYLNDTSESMVREFDSFVSPDGAYPIQNVTWGEAVRFCNWLSEHEQLTPCYRYDKLVKADDREAERWDCDFAADGYRLPTDVEWEYACRAGTETVFSFGSDYSILPRYGHSSNNRKVQARVPGSLMPNRWGLYDMHGNMWEWCWDWSEDFPPTWQERSTGPDGPSELGAEWGRVHRGGGIANYSGDPISAARGIAIADSTFFNVGFRLVRSRVQSVP